MIKKTKKTHITKTNIRRMPQGQCYGTSSAGVLYNDTHPFYFPYVTVSVCYVSFFGIWDFCMQSAPQMPLMDT